MTRDSRSDSTPDTNPTPGPDTGGPRQRFLRGETGPEETAALVRSALLADGVPEAWEPQEVPAESYGTVLEAAAAAVISTALPEVRREEEAAAHLLDEIAGTAAEQRLELVRTDPRFATWAAVDELCQASLAACTRDPEAAVELARLAVAAAEAAAPELAGRVAGPAEAGTAADREAFDLMALAHGQLANALRVASDLRSADRSLARGFDLAAAGTGDPLIRARLNSLAASLRGDQSRYAEGLALALRASRLYRRIGDDHRYGRTLLKVATLQAYREDLEEACSSLMEALDHLDAGAEPRLAAVAHHNFASYLERLGQPDQAAVELDAAERLLARVEEQAGGRSREHLSLDRARLTWLRGRIALGAGDRQRGEELLEEARHVFVDRGLAYEAAQVALELALIYAEAGRVADQRRLAEEMLPIFTSRDLHAEARAALKIYTEAARTQAAGESLIRKLSAALDRAGGAPGVPFKSG